MNDPAPNLALGTVRRPGRWDWAWPVVCFLGALLASSQALLKGQVIKQFFAYSISEALAKNPWNWLSTTLPCVPMRTWVEEPPVFHFLAAWGLKLWPGQSAFVPALAFSLLAWVALKWIREWRLSERDTWIFVILAATAPVFLRYSIQHLPDLLATALLAWGAWALWRRHRFFATVLFTLSVTAKALTGLAVASLLAWEFWVQVQPRLQNRGEWIRGLAAVGTKLDFIVLPFLVWVIVVKRADIPSPFQFGSVGENRHSGGFGLLLSVPYWSRIFTWLAIKGVGLPLFFAAIPVLVRTLREKRLHEADGFLTAWALSALPYWLLVRQGNFVHDYYTLPIALPWALLGCRTLGTALSGRFRMWAFSLIGLQLLLALLNFRGLRPMVLSPEQERPTYCEMERWGER